MGSEILDSTGRLDMAAPALMLPTARAAGWGPGAEPVPTLDLPFLELELAGPAPTPVPPRLPVTEAFVAWARRLRTDRSSRRTALGAVAAALVIVVVTSLAVHARAAHRLAAAEAGLLAVDVRITAVPATSDAPQTPSSVVVGSAAAEVLVHNLGPRDVHLLGVDYYATLSRDHGGSLFTSNVDVAPQEQLDQSFPVTLPCSPFDPLGSPTTATARLRTADGRVHVVPVDLSQLQGTGGLLGACAAYIDRTDEAANTYRSQVIDGSVRIQMTVGDVNGFDRSPVVIALETNDFLAPVTFTTEPRLPLTARAGSHLSILVTPVASRCPTTAEIDYPQLSQIAISVSGETMYDENLPLVTARAIGLACAGGRR